MLKDGVACLFEHTHRELDVVGTVVDEQHP
jgi:hypothetical protein